jgi:copper(I)-binding protein
MFSKLAAIAAVFFATATMAADPVIRFSDQYAEPAMGKVGVAFFTATTTKDDTITGVTSGCCEAVELHRNEMSNGVMRMRKVSRLPIEKENPLLVQRSKRSGLSLAPGTPEGTTITTSLGGGGGLAGDSLHVMLIGLKQPLNAGDIVPLTFTFEKAPPQTVEFTVKPREGKAPAADPHAHH